LKILHPHTNTYNHAHKRAPTHAMQHPFNTHTFLRIGIGLSRRRHIHTCSGIRRPTWRSAGRLFPCTRTLLLETIQKGNRVMVRNIFMLHTVRSDINARYLLMRKMRGVLSRIIKYRIK
jgi:hypothetical protein